MKPNPDIVAAMELLLSKQQIARIMQQTWTGRDRVAVLRRAVTLGLDAIDEHDAHQRLYSDPPPAPPLHSQ